MKKNGVVAEREEGGRSIRVREKKEVGGERRGRRKKRGERGGELFLRAGGVW